MYYIFCRVSAGYVVDRKQGSTSGLVNIFGLKEVSDKPFSVLQTRSFTGNGHYRLLINTAQLLTYIYDNVNIQKWRL
jgi:hypothetical protein